MKVASRGQFEACTSIREVLELGKPKQGSGASDVTNVTTEDTLKQNTPDPKKFGTEETRKSSD